MIWGLEISDLLFIIRPHCVRWDCKENLRCGAIMKHFHSWLQSDREPQRKVFWFGQNYFASSCSSFVVVLVAKLQKVHTRSRLNLHSTILLAINASQKILISECMLFTHLSELHKTCLKLKCSGSKGNEFRSNREEKVKNRKILSQLAMLLSESCNLMRNGSSGRSSDWKEHKLTSSIVFRLVIKLSLSASEIEI